MNELGVILLFYNSPDFPFVLTTVLNSYLETRNKFCVSFRRRRSKVDDFHRTWLVHSFSLIHGVDHMPKDSGECL